MDYIYIFILDIFCIILGVIGARVPLSAFVAFIISITVLWDLLTSNVITDSSLVTLTVITIIITLLCGIIGYRRKD